MKAIFISPQLSKSEITSIVSQLMASKKIYQVIDTSSLVAVIGARTLDLPRNCYSEPSTSCHSGLDLESKTAHFSLKRPYLGTGLLKEGLRSIISVAQAKGENLIITGNSLTYELANEVSNGNFEFIRTTEDM